MPHDDRSAAARAALAALPAASITEVLGLLCRDRPEAVMAAVESLARHQSVVASLLSREAPEQRSGAS